MRFLSYAIVLLTIILCFTACDTTETTAPVSEQQDIPLASISEPADEPVSQDEANRLPYERQIASITPAQHDKILEKKAQNGDSVGWLVVPDTTIDDVILLNPPGNNSYYTTHDFHKQPNKDGAYGIDYHYGFSGATTRADFSRNTTLYAHNHDDNPNGILFAQLKKYKDPEFAKTHPYIFFSTEDEDMVWEVFAVYDASTDFPYIDAGVYWSTYEKLLETVYDASIYDYGVRIEQSDKLLTLSTCTFSVDGHESMPITQTNKYRFVIMARLVEPDDEIKTETVFTINENPLAPDDIPPFDFLKDDYFMLNDLVCRNSWMFFYENDYIEPINFDKLVPIGKIEQSNVDAPAHNWQATQLPVGTVIYQDPDYVDTLVADVGWAMIPYIAQKWEREISSVRYIHQKGGSIITDKTLEAGQFEESAHMERLSPFIDMIYFKPLSDSIHTVALNKDKDTIRLGAKNSLATFYQTFYIGTPESVGKEVMIIRQEDGYYYGDAALYPQLAELLDSLFT